METTEWKELLRNTKRIEREHGVELLRHAYADADDSERTRIEGYILDMLRSTDIRWEEKQGALLATKVILTSKSEHKTAEECAKSESEFVSEVQLIVVALLEHPEYAVRITAGDVMGALCMLIGPSVFISIRDTVLSGVRKNLEAAGQCCDKSSSNSELPPHDMTAAELRDASHWKQLETWLKCLESLISACGKDGSAYVDNELLDIISCTLSSSSRFVRETTFTLLSSIVATDFITGRRLLSSEESVVCQLSENLAKMIAVGLADSCSQVRMAACIAARKFLYSLPTPAVEQQCFTALLPGLCFNRYYTAEGVRIYSQETWNAVTGGKGKQLVEQHIADVVKFYLSQLADRNAEVKDTACLCITELSQKMEKTVLSQHVVHLLSALQRAHNDICYSTRDASCVACGKLIASFPDESKPLMTSMYDSLFSRLQDNMPPVREAAAIALSCIVSAHGDEAMLLVLDHIKQGMDAVGTEIPSQTSDACGTDGSTHQTGNSSHPKSGNSQETVVGISSTVELPLVSGMVVQCQRPAEPWELADGCLCLMNELSLIPACVTNVAKLLPSLAAAASHKNYPHHVFFLQSVCKQLPVLFKRLGKRILKMYLDIFFDVIFYAVSVDSLPVTEAAHECIRSLSADLGPNIFHARVESYNPRCLQYLQP